ncbi:hypothetical protein [Herbidospora cretacea]|uniref:hypothetical protein n=1 Tax=Herbidospora cretacea TaxID=28444 RepID=UPI0012DCBE24|nr:hypothetical protein [Herbidospora cretacea]
MRSWSALVPLVPLAALLLAGAPPAQAATSPSATVASATVQPPSYVGPCYEGKEFLFSAAITADGPGTVWYQWSHYPTPVAVDFTEAGTRTVTSVRTHYSEWLPATSTIEVLQPQASAATVTYGLTCTDPVPGMPRIEPANDHVGRCGTGVVHRITAQLRSPIAQTVRYSWVGYDGRELPGAEGVHEARFTEPGTQTVSAPLMRLPVASVHGWETAKLLVRSPGAVTDQVLSFRTACVNAEFTALTRVTGTCKPATPYKFRADGHVESTATVPVSYAWSRLTEDGEWRRDTWKELSFTTANTPGAQAVSKTFLAATGESGAVRLEVLGTDGNVVSTVRTYKTCNVV